MNLIHGLALGACGPGDFVYGLQQRPLGEEAHHSMLIIHAHVNVVLSINDKSVMVFQAMWNKSVSADITTSDEWKLSLLDVLCADYYFTVDQLISMLGAFEFPGEQV